MRIGRLRLDAWGSHPAGTALQFPAAGRDLHIVFGSNEAGKSTVLRAATALLFGVPRGSPDDHAVGRKQAVSGELCLADGRSLDIRRTREKGKGTASLGGTRLDEEAIQPLIGIKEDYWSLLFGFSDRELSKGAQALRDVPLERALEHEGDPNAAIDRLKKDAEQIHRTSRGKSALLDLVATVELCEARVKASRLDPERWHDLVTAHDTAGAVAEAARAGVAGAQQGVDRLARLRDAVPKLRRRASATAEAADLIAIPGVDAAFLHAVESALKRREDALTALNAASSARLAAEDRRTAIVIPTPLVTVGPAIDRLLVEAKRWREEAAGLPNRQERLRSEAAALDRDRSSVVREAAGLSAVAPHRVERVRAAASSVLEIRTAAVDLERRSAEHAASNASLGTEPPPGPLPAELESLQSALALGESLAGIASTWLDVATAAEDAHVEEHRRRVPVEAGMLPGHVLDTPGAVPLRAHIQESARERAALADALRECEKVLAATTRSLSELEDRLHIDDTLARVPDLADLARLRAERGLAWQRVASSLEVGPALAPLELVVALRQVETATAAADSLADSLFAQAAAVADRRARGAELAVRRVRQAEATELVAHATGALAGWDAGWETTLAASGIARMSPTAALDWWDAHAVWTASAAIAASTAGRREAARLDLEAGCARMAQALGEPPGPWAPLVARLKSRIATADSTRQVHAQWGRERDRIAIEGGRIVADRTALAGRTERVLLDWHRALDDAGAPADLDPSRHREWEARLQSVVEGTARHAAEREDLARMASDLAHWEEEAIGVVAPLAPGAVERSALALLSWAGPALAAARDCVRQAELADTAVANATLVESQRSEQLQEIERDLAKRRAVVGAPDDETLRRQAAGSVLAAEKQAEVQRIDDDLARLRNGEAPQSFDRDALDFPSPAERLAGAESDLVALQHAHARAEQELGAARHAWEAHKGGSAAAEAHQEAENARTQLRREVDRWLVLRAAHHLLELAVQRADRDRQPRVIERASALFKSLTAGRYAGVLEEDGAFRAVTATDEPRDPRALSEGTLQQLFFAGRLAYAEQYNRDHEPMPLMLDDALAAFDDHRASAALRILGEFAAGQQVILLTHHAHLVALARSTVPDANLITLAG